MKKIVTAVMDESVLNELLYSFPDEKVKIWKITNDTSHDLYNLAEMIGNKKHDHFIFMDDIYTSVYLSALNDFMNVLKSYKKEINTSNTPWNFIELCYNKLINKED